MVKQLKMKKSDAHENAVKCLHFLASNEDYLGDFLSITGLGPGNLRQAAQDPNFLNAVITFIMDDEKRVMDCAAAINVEPEALSQTYNILVGFIDHNID